MCAIVKADIMFRNVTYIPDNNMLQASIILTQYRAEEHFITVTSHNPPTSMALTEHQTDDSETEEERRVRGAGKMRRGERAA